MRNHLRAYSPEVAIRNNFVEINFATIVASFNRTIRKNSNTAINNSVYDVLFTNEAWLRRRTFHVPNLTE